MLPRLRTECKDKTSDWVTAWMWHCNTKDFMLPLAGDNRFSNTYVVDFRAAYPGPDHAQPGVLAPDVAGVNDCYEAGKGKSCHITGQAYFFGEADNQGIEQTEEELEFGMKYREMYAKLIKEGASGQMETWEETGGKFNLVDISTEITTSDPHPMTCALFNQIQQYGNI